MTAKTKISKLPIPIKSLGEFLILNDERIRKTTIKRYRADKNAVVTIYFNSSYNKPDCRQYNFTTIVRQQEVLAYLDSIYL
jgi:hypothetical protein